MLLLVSLWAARRISILGRQKERCSVKPCKTLLTTRNSTRAPLLPTHCAHCHPLAACQSRSQRWPLNFLRARKRKQRVFRMLSLHTQKIPRSSPQFQSQSRRISHKRRSPYQFRTVTAFPLMKFLVPGLSLKSPQCLPMMPPCCKAHRNRASRFKRIISESPRNLWIICLHRKEHSMQLQSRNRR